MNNISLLIWGFSGFLSGLSFVFVQYHIHRQKHMKLLSDLENAEIDLLRDLHKLNEQQALGNQLRTQGDKFEDLELEIKKFIASQEIKKKSEQNKSTSQRNAWKPFSLKTNIPIVGAIPAGTPREMSLQNEGDFLTLSLESKSNFLDKEYSWFSLRRENEMLLQLNHQYFILQVSGNSMNLSTPIPIEDGDMVLIRRDILAKTGDIVAVEIFQDEPEATLKRYLFRDGYHVLQPESNDPAFQSRMLIKKDFSIRGIALAVLKQIHQK